MTPTQTDNIMPLIAKAPWREAVTYRDTWPHEYVVIKKDGQQELLARRSWTGSGRGRVSSVPSLGNGGHIFSSAATSTG